MSSTNTATQELVCRVGQHSWSRPAQAGRPPVVCDEHRLYGAPRPSTLAPAAKTGAPTPPPAPKKQEGQHYAFPILRQFAEASENAYLYGPSGSGKTQGARMLADLLSLPFLEQPCHPLMNSEELFGFMGLHSYTPGIVREWLENPEGGILLLDEMDAANPALLVAINLVSSLNVGQSYRFPDGKRFTRTANHIMIGAGNTNGLGATADYVGRSALDRATLTRFAFLPWGYDEKLEFMMAGNDAIGKEWVTWVQAVRRIAQENSLNLLVTPRASIKGANMLRQGMKRRDVENAFVFMGCDDDTMKTVRALMRKDQGPATPEALNAGTGF